MKVCLVGAVLSRVDKHDKANRTCCNYVNMPKTLSSFNLMIMW